MRNILSISFLLIIGCGIYISCEEEKTPLLTLSVESITLQADETIGKFTIHSNVGWVIYTDTNWCTVSPEYGSGTEDITIQLSNVNESYKTPLTAIITVQSGQAVSQKLEVIQQLKPSEKIIAEEFTFRFDVGMSMFSNWNYFSFEEGGFIDKAPINSENDAEWKQSLEWDLALSPLYAKTNSGESGIGLGGAIEIGADDENKEKVFYELLKAPEEGYETDRIIENMKIGMPANARYTGPGSELISSWIELGEGQNDTKVTPKVFVIKTANGNYAKLYMKEWSSSSLTFIYAYQTNGTGNLETVN